MADKLKSNQGDQARALWTTKGKEAFTLELATDGAQEQSKLLEGRGTRRR
jgi:hypothetical protein